MISKSHYLDLEDGKFSGTNASNLQGMFDAIEDDGNANHLIIHFHGGLVSREDSLGMAERLLPVYRQANAFPVFFVWNSDLKSTFKNNLDEIFSEKVFERLLQILGNYLVGKLVDSVGGRSSGKLSLDSMRKYEKSRKELIDLIDEGEAEYESTLKHADASEDELELSKEQIEQLEQILTEDTPLQEQQALILAGLREQGVIENELGSRDASVPVRGSTSTLMSPSVLKEIAEEESDTRSATLAWTIAKHGVKITAKVLKRYWHGRDHGVYTTIVEEILRHLYLDNLGSLTWGLIKDDTEDAFDANPEIHGGTAFIGQLAKWWESGRRISLVGHSTGAIYIGHFLEAMDKALPAEAKADVVFLAPACTFDFLHDRIDLFQRRVTGWRSFGLKDEIEAGYWEVPGYRGSLLYMVSGLAEGDSEDSLDQVDKPLVGMQRYFDRTDIYDSEAVVSVRRYAGDNCIWSEEDAGSGRRSSAQKHGDFDEDEPTLKSVVDFLSESL